MVVLDFLSRRLVYCSNNQARYTMSSTAHETFGNRQLFQDFSNGIQRGMDSAEWEQLGPDDLERAYTVRLVSPDIARSALTLLKNAENPQSLRWNKKLLTAAVDLAQRYQQLDDGDAVAPSPDGFVDEPATSADILTVQHEATQAQIEGTPERSDQFSQPDSLDQSVIEAVNEDTVVREDPAHARTMSVAANERDDTVSISPSLTVVTIAPERKSRRARSREHAQTRNPDALPTIADVDTIDSRSRFSELSLDQQRIIVTKDLADALEIAPATIRKLLDPHAMSHFTNDEIGAVEAIRDLLCLRINKQVASSNGILPDIQQCFGSQEVNRRLATFVGLRTEMKGKKRQIKTVSPRRVYDVRSLVDRPQLGERDLLRGLRFIAQYTENTKLLDQTASNEELAG